MHVSISLHRTVVAFVVALVLGAPGTASAANYNLFPTPESPFQDAGGSAQTTYGKTYYDYWSGIKYTYVEVTFEVWGLAPNADYNFSGISIHTDWSGAASGWLWSGYTSGRRIGGFWVYDPVNDMIVLKTK